MCARARNILTTYISSVKLTVVFLTLCYDFAPNIEWDLNPFTAPACKISGLKDARNSILSGPIAHLPSALCVLMKTLSHAGAKEKAKSLKDKSKVRGDF